VPPLTTLAAPEQSEPVELSCIRWIKSPGELSSVRSPFYSHSWSKLCFISAVSAIIYHTPIIWSGPSMGRSKLSDRSRATKTKGPQWLTTQGFRPSLPMPCSLQLASVLGCLPSLPPCHSCNRNLYMPSRQACKTYSSQREVSLPIMF
jgi:hypothetical protein